MEAIYLDHAATTPVHPEVLEEMVDVYQKIFGNPSSIHQFGREARKVIDEARDALGRQIGTEGKNIVFTSGGTEADNMAIIGAALANQEKGKHIITSKIEHHAVLHTCQNLEEQGFEVTYLDVNSNGRLDLNDIQQALRDDTILVTLVYGNNEVGTLQPIREIAHLLRPHQALFHTDAVQAFGTIDIDVREAPIDLLSLTAHKINGPKGAGLLYVREGVPISPYSYGGEQERKRRPGTQNVPGIVGLQKAAEISAESILPRMDTYFAYRKILLNTLEKNDIEYKINGDPDHFLPHILNLYFPGTNVEALLVNLDLAGVAVSSGSACTAGSIEPSHVLTAMYGKESERAKASVRISFGYGLSTEAIQKAAAIIAKTVKRMKQ
ncbi:cysteine desulfurase [Scopulibacillus darangshiensis]|uniref:cysteine desulfurase n=1 Tax=Scopulibacillus darangshiensis TaxID=442528 RepID=A0A4R2PCV5_9BACL|nr:cysteine desulfurase family protein [Scopulibacillus darangshiensis]TCP32278.1 cysteine desulfurase [Scopulibacillus darangshiensis]